MLFSVIAILCFLTIAGAFRASQLALFSPNTTLDRPWKSCGNLASYPLECGRLSVPLDYADPSIGMASLSIMRLLADPDRRLGSLFTNPGGPGVPGTGDYMRMRAVEIMEQSGGLYDIVRSAVPCLRNNTLSLSDASMQLGHSRG
jgi:hypothetical protein